MLRPLQGLRPAPRGHRGGGGAQPARKKSPTINLCRFFPKKPPRRPAGAAAERRISEGRRPFPESPQADAIFPREVQPALSRI